MKRIETLEEIHNLELGILDAFHELCIENDIKYSLAAGTMIGAVRHKGFIPWDDDIDIFMLREEYEKILSIAKNNSIIKDRYKILQPYETAYPFIKIIDLNTYVNEFEVFDEYAIGIWIDIFPVDNAFYSLDKNTKLLEYRQKLIFRRNCCMNPTGSSITHTVVKKAYVAAMTLTGHGYKYWIKKLRIIPMLNPSSYKGTFTWTMSLKDIYPADYFDGYTELEFEGKKYMSFARYDDILTWRYGDYMQLPPESERVSHNIEAYYKD